MTCGSYEAESRRYRKVEDKNGDVWLIAIQENAAENIYFHNPKDHNSDGFAGRTLEFTLEDGTVYSAKGPWHTNAGSLYEATGIDVRNTHGTRVAIGLGIAKGWMRLKDVIYFEENAILGRFDRYTEIAQKYADELDRPVQYLMESSGGGSMGPIKPTNWTQEQYDGFWKNELS